MFTVPAREFFSVDIPRVADTALEPYVIAWVSLLADSPLGLKPVGLVRKFLDSICTLTRYREVARSMKVLRNAFIAIIATDSGRNKSSLDDVIFEGFKALPILKEILHAIRTHDVKSVTYVLSFLYLGQKTVYENTDDLELAALRGWLNVESRLNEFVLPDYSPQLRAIMTEIIKSANAEGQLRFDHDILPSHGGGRVAEVGLATALQKDSHLSMRKSFLYACLQQTSLSRFIPQNGKIVFAVLRSRLKFVFKDIFKMRSMCMEPSGVQYGQQSVRWSLERMIKRSVAGRFIRLEDQEWNSDAARAGSSMQHIDTIDLSDASDSVSAVLVRAVFPACVYKWLRLTQSDLVLLPDGSEVKPHKFAPMGSATTFPVQSLIYLCVVLYAYHKRTFGSDAIVTPNSFAELMRLIQDDPWVDPLGGMPACRVYGDDIICASSVTEDVMEMLTQMKFTVNADKSFTGESLYRESCGGHFLNGSEVTAYSFKPNATRGIMTGPLLVSVMDAANRALRYGYGTLRLNLLRYAHFKHHKHKGLLVKPRPLAYADRRIVGPRPDFAPEGRMKYMYGHNAQTDPLIRRYTERVVDILVKTEDTEMDPVRGLIGFYRRSSDGTNSLNWFDHLPKGRPVELVDLLDDPEIEADFVDFIPD